MKSIKASSAGSILVGEDSAKEIFINLLELFLNGDRDEEIEINFSSVMTIDPQFFTAFVLLCAESNQFGLERLTNQVMFSGLFAKDIESLYAALAPARKNNSMDMEEMRKHLRDAYDKRQKEVWGNDPRMKNIFDKVTGAIENALNNVPDFGKK